MFFPEGQIRVHLYGHPCDMRKSFPGLYALTRQGLQADPLNGDLYVFISRRATQMKVLYFDRSGFCIWSKRLEAGRFISDWSQVRTRQMEWTGLKLLLEGIEPGRLRKRYRLPTATKQHRSNTSNPLDLADAEVIPDIGTQRDADRLVEPGGNQRDVPVAGADDR
jgi:transposase